MEQQQYDRVRRSIDPQEFQFCRVINSIEPSVQMEDVVNRIKWTWEREKK